MCISIEGDSAYNALQPHVKSAVNTNTFGKRFKHALIDPYVYKLT